MIKKPIKAVTEFHNAFGLSVELKPKADLPSPITELRYNLMKEENEEYLEAVKSNDLIGFVIIMPSFAKASRFGVSLNRAQFEQP